MFVLVGDQDSLDEIEQLPTDEEDDALEINPISGTATTPALREWSSSLKKLFTIYRTAGVMRSSTDPSEIPQARFVNLEEATAYWAKLNAKRACHLCDSLDHKADNCPSPHAKWDCKRCGQIGHSASECQNDRVETRTCRKCNVKGHNAGDCPDRICLKCSEKGHHISTWYVPNLLGVLF